MMLQGIEYAKALLMTKYLNLFVHQRGEKENISPFLLFQETVLLCVLSSSFWPEVEVPSRYRRSTA